MKQNINLIASNAAEKQGDRMFNIFKKTKTHEKKASRFSTMLSCQMPGRSIYNDMNFDHLARNGYKTNVAVYRCIKIIADSIASIPPVVIVDGEKVYEHKVLSLLQQPNPLQGHNAFFESLVSYLLLSGNSYIEAVAESKDVHEPAELYVLRPDRMRVIPGSNGFPVAYEYSMGREKNKVKIDPINGHSDILHLKFFNPLNDWYGQSPLEATDPAVRLYNSITEQNISLLANEGRLSGAFILKNKNGISDKQKQEFRDSVERIYSGTKNAGKIALLEGDVEWNPMGNEKQHEFDFMKGKEFALREICQAFGVPPILVGATSDATFSNYREARLHFWEETVLPLMEYILSLLNNWLSQYFGYGFKLSYDKDAIHALGDKRAEVWNRIKEAHFLTINEQRAFAGLGPIEGGDVVAYHTLQNNAQKENDGPKNPHKNLSNTAI